MKISNLPLSKIVNVSTGLMLVALAFSLHSLAAEVKEQLNKPSPPQTQPHPLKPKKKVKKSSKGEEKNFVTEEELGWVHNIKPKDTEKGSPTEDSPLSDPLTHAAEQKLKETIKERQEQNNPHFQYLNNQQTALEREKENINNQLKELDQKTTELSQDQESKKKDSEQKFVRLAHVYEEMPPRDAAAVFNVLDMRVLVPVAQHMSPRKVSAVIGGMLPDRANILTQYLIGARKLSSDEK